MEQVATQAESRQSGPPVAYTLAGLVRRGPYSKNKWRRLIASGALKAKRDGRNLIVTHADLVAYFNFLPATRLNGERR